MLTGDTVSRLRATGPGSADTDRTNSHVVLITGSLHELGDHACQRRIMRFGNHIAFNLNPGGGR